MTRGKKHTLEEIIEGIKKARKEGIDLRTSKIQKTKYRWMYRPHKYYFSNWKETLKAAGISYKLLQNQAKRRKKALLEPERLELREELKEAYKNGVDLSSTVLQDVNNPYHHLRLKGKRFYEGRLFWENALLDANLPVDKIVRLRVWTQEKVKKHLKKRNAEGKPMYCVAIKKDDYVLYKAAVTHFPSFDKALRGIGLDPKTIRLISKSLTNKELSDLVHKWNNEGLSLKAVDLRGDSERSKYYYQVIRRVGPWYDFLKTIGLDTTSYRRRRHWNKDKIISEIKKLYPEGIVTNLSHKLYLYKAAYNNFDDVRLAIAAADRIYLPNGKITKEMLDDKKVVEIITECNKKFFDRVSEKLYSTLDSVHDLKVSGLEFADEMFTRVIKALPNKPDKMSIRDFSKVPIACYLDEITTK